MLVAPAATTHGADMNQRLVELGTLRSVDGVGLDVQSPAGPGAAPPGYYMLFVLDADGTPSIARWVRVTADAPVPGTLPDYVPTPTPTATRHADGDPHTRADRHRPHRPRFPRRDRRPPTAPPRARRSRSPATAAASTSSSSSPRRAGPRSSSASARAARQADALLLPRARDAARSRSPRRAASRGSR